MILLSFDVEEFDMPLEYGHNLEFKDQIRISETGTVIILDLLKKHNLQATFFCTATFAINCKHLLNRMIDEGHEVASHGYYHSDFETKHLAESKHVLEGITGQRIDGYRMARMAPFDKTALKAAGYVYNSSLNPTYLPGRYNNLSAPRKYYKEDDVMQIPASVTPFFRFPLFWLSFHNLPMWLYLSFSRWTLRNDGYLNIYLHPWEFTDLTVIPEFPRYVTRNCGDALVMRLEKFILWAKLNNVPFKTFRSFIKEI